MTFTIGRAALVAVLTVASIGGVFAAGQEDAAAGSEPARISYMIFDNGRYATTLEDHIILRELGKRFNVDWDMQPVPSSDFTSKFNVLVASGDLADISVYMGRDWPTVLSDYGRQGLLFDFAPHLDKLPNIVRNFYEKIPNSLKNSMTDDGQIFFIGRLKTTTADNFSPAFMYRKDVFDEMGMTPGTTFDGFFQNLVDLKLAFPDQFPFSVPHGSSWMVRWFSSLFETGVNQGYVNSIGGIYFDYWNTNDYQAGGIDDNYRQELEFLHRLHDEGLLHPEFAADRGRATYQKLVINNEIFMGLNSSAVSIGTLNVAGRAENDNPDFSWMMTEWPSYRGPGQVTTYLDVDAGGKVVNAKTAHADLILEIFDYMGSDDYRTLQFFGVDGETFTYAGGEPQFLPDYADPQKAWKRGLGEDYTGILGYFEGRQEASNSELTQIQWQFYDDVGAGLPDEPYLSFTSSESRELRELLAVSTYQTEMAHKFIIGEERLDDAAWEAYVARCRELGIDRKVAIFQAAHQRYLQRQP